MRKIGRFLGAVLLAILLLPNTVKTAPLGSVTIRVLGIQVDVDTRPDVEGLQSTMTAVKDFPTAIHTVVGVPGMTSLPTLPEGFVVKAELAGPGLGEEVLTLASLPNQPLEIPQLAASGDHFLYNVRLEDSAGRVILPRAPTREPVVINVIEKLLVTQVTSRALTLDEIKEKGIVIDEDNFTAVNFTVGLTLGSEEVTIELPVVLPTTMQAAAKVEPPKLTGLPSVQRAFDRINIPNFSLSGFQLRVPPEFEEGKKIELPPINGVIIIPGNIGFLNQFFSVILQATNIAPDGSGLVLKNTRASIVLPLGEDDIINTGDDPLRVAETEKGGVQDVLPLLDPQGTDTIVPQGTNQAEFLVEGMREGTQKLSFDITGDLYVPSLGKTVAMTGKAAGVVQVKNPTFSIVLCHPDVVREGEAYSIFATVTNTSTTPANMFQLALNTPSLSGARLAEEATDMHTLEALNPGQAESFEFRMVAQTTGEVTGTVFLADEGINGSFLLTTGVGDTGIPLSPDTLVLPKTVDYLPDEPDMLFQAVRMLGQAYSVATAPAGSLPPAISRISKGFVFERAIKLAQVGLHVRFGEPLTTAIADIIMDTFGNDMGRLAALSGGDDEEAERLKRNMEAFDDLRRAADAGNDLSDVLGELLGTLTDGPETLAALQKDWAATFASRPPHLSFGAFSYGAPVFLRLTDPEGKALGRLEPNAPLLREIPFADRLPLVQTEALHGEILFQAVPAAPAYTLEWAVAEGTTLDLSLVLPGPKGLIQVTYAPLHLERGGYGRLSWSAEGENGYAFKVDQDGDGTLELNLEPMAVEEIIDPPPRLLGVVQWAKGARPELSPSFKYGDPLGRMLGILFSEEVTRDTALDAPNYQVEENRVIEISLQPDRRLAFAVTERPVGPFVERSLTISGVEDPQGHFMVDESQPIRSDPERGVGGTLHGQVLSAEGDPVPFAGVKYIQPLQYPVLEGGCMGGAADVEDYVIFNTDADAQGRFSIDFVLQAAFPSGCPSNPDIWLNENNPGGTDNFKLEATDPETGEVGKVSTKIHYDGQRMRLKVVIRGYGSIRGTVFDEEDNLVRGGDPFTSDVLWVHARNISTGEMYRSWVDGEGFYSFPREFKSEDGRTQEAPKVVVGNLILHLVRPQDGFTAVTTVNLPGGGGVAEQDLLMISPLRYGTVTGRVLEAGGLKGAPNVLVQIAGRVLTGVDLYSRNYSTGVVGATHTDGEGFFRFENIPAGDIEVRSVRQATYEEAGAKSVLAEGGEASLTLVYPGPGGTVRGIVRDAFGNLVPQATVAGGPTLTETDEEGFFEVTGLPLGTYIFYAQSKESPALGKVKVQTLGPDDVQEVIITLEPTGSVEGTVFRADGVTPVRGQKVQLWLEPNKGVLADSLTDQKGEFHFKEYPLGEYSVRAVERDHGDGGMVYTAIRFPGDSRDADITFRGMGEIKGRVVQRNGTPVMSDVIITHKVWRIFTDCDAAGGPKIFMAFIREVQSQLEEAAAEQIEKALQEAGLSNPGADFFMLVDESVLISSDIKGPQGEVTGGFSSAGAVAGPFTVAAFGPFLTPAEVIGEIPKTIAAAERIIDVGDVLLEPATSAVRGTVYLPDGKTPVGAGVSVKIRSLASSGSVMTATGAVQQPVLPEYGVVTDGRGQFHFPLVLRGRFILTVDTGAPDGAIRARTAEQMETEQFADQEGNRRLNVRLYGRAGGAAPAGDTLDVNIRLHDAAGLKVKVLANDGQTPVPFAKVSLKTNLVLDEDQEKTFQQLNADKNGEISFFPVIEGRFSVRARHPKSPARGQAVGRVPQDPENGLVIPITVTLGAVTTAKGEVVPAQFFGTVEGTVFRADGNPQDNPVQVTVRSRGVGILTTSDSQGRYLAEDVPGGLLTIEAFEPFTARRGSAKGKLTKEGQVVEVPLTLVGLGTVTGSVMSNAGDQRLRGLDVLLYPTGRFTDTLITRTDPQGSYTLPGVPLGPYRVKVNDPHSVLTGSAEGVMRKDGERITTDVRLEPSGRIEGTLYGAGVRFDENGNPVNSQGEVLENPPLVANAGVAIRGPRIEQTVQTDDHGKFRSGEFLPLGEYILTARPVKGEDGVVQKTKVQFEGQTAKIAVALSGTGVVEGVILDSQGQKPVATARVTVISRSPFSKGPISRFTKKDGVFRFENVPVGDFSISALTTVGEPQLRAAAEGTLARHAQVFAYRNGAPPDSGQPAIRLQPAGEIAGSVLLPDGQTAAKGAIVVLKSRNVRLGRLADEKGAFHFDAVPLGTYKLSIREPSANAVAQHSLSLEKNGQAIDLASVVLDGEPPTVVATEPKENSVGVRTNAPIVITFSEPIEPTSVQGRSFRVTLAGKPVHGRIEVSSEKNQASFFPARPLPDLTPVRVALQGHHLGFEGQILEPGVMDLAGQGLKPRVAYTFTTGDFTKPSVTKVSPAEGASSVPLRSVFRIEFSEPVDPQSIQNVTLAANGKPVQGRLNTQPIMGGRVLVFTPAGPLLPDAAYTAVIQGPVRDLAGNAMEETELKFNFATRDTIPPVIQTVALATGMTAVSGKKVLLNVTLEDDSDVALVEYYLNGELAQTVRDAPFASRVYLAPALGERMTVGAVAVDRMGNRSAQALLRLTIAPNMPPTVRIASPGNGQVSAGQIVALQIAGSDDVGIVELGFTADQGQLASGRKILAPATAVQQVFTFKVPMDFPIGDSIRVRAVAGDTQGLIAVSETVNLDVLGKLPPEVAIVGAANNEPLDPGEEVPIQVVADDPTGITEVSLSGTGLLTFSQVRPLDPAKAQVREPFEITIPIDASPTQTLRLTARAVDTRGNAGSRDVIIRINDRIAPTVTLGPRRGKPQVEPGAKIVLRTTAQDEIGVEHIDLLVDGEAVQTRAIRPTLATTQDFTLSIENDMALNQELKIQATVKDAAGNVGIGEMTLLVKDLTAPKVQLSTSAPENLIRAGDTLNVRIKAEDRFGVAALKYRVANAIKDQGEFLMDPVETAPEREFTLEVPSDKTGGGRIDLIAEAYDGTGNRRDTRWFHVRIQDVVPPEVVRVRPPNDATDVIPTTHIRFDFSEGIARKTGNMENILVRGPAGPVAGAVQVEYYSNRWVIFKPTEPLERGKRYTVTATVAITDPTGNPLKEAFTSSFTTDNTGPAITELLPTDGADGVEATPVIRVRFNEALKRETLTPEAFSLVDDAGAAVPAETTWRDGYRTLELRPKAALALGGQYGIRLTGQLTDAAGNSITTADGKPIEELTHQFTTGTIRFLSPQDGGTVLEKTRIPLEISPEGLTVDRVVFEVNGRRLSPVPGPVFRMAYQVPAMMDAPHLTITAVAMDEKGKEIARKSLSTTVVPGLQNEPAILGVSMGGKSHFRLFLSVPLETDLPVKLAVQEPSVARLPGESLVLKAGKKELRVPVEGVSKGNTFLTIQSERGNAALTVSVSEPSPDTQQTVSSLPMGLCIQPAAFTQSLLIPKAGDYTLSIPLLATHARSEISVEVSGRPVDILDVPNRATIAAGSRLARVSFKIKAVGEAALRLKVEDTVTQLRLVVGEPVQEAMQFLSGVASRPIGLSLKALPSPGPIHLPRPGTYTLTVPLLARPLTAKTRVEISNRTPAIVEVEEEDVSIAEGSQAATLALKAKGEGKGEVFLTTGEQVYRLPIIVGDVETALPPAAASQLVGMAVTPPAFSGQIIVPHLGKRQISVPLLPSVVTEETFVMVTSDQPEAMEVPEKTVIPAGSRMVRIALNLNEAGSALLKLQVGDRVTWVPVMAGPAAETVGAGVMSVPLGMAVTPAGTAARVFLIGGTKIHIQLSLLSVPATKDVPVEVRNRDPKIAQASAAASNIAEGRRTLEMTLTAPSGAIGTALTELHYADTVKTLAVIVGPPTVVTDGPKVIAPVVGLEVKE